MSEREVAQSPVAQGSAESRPYAFDFTGCELGTLQSATVRLDDLTSVPPTDVSATKLSSATGVVDNDAQTVTTGLVQTLIAGHKYRLRCKVTNVAGRVDELYCVLVCDF
jgi:hypothetical protein